MNIFAFIHHFVSYLLGTPKAKLVKNLEIEGVCLVKTAVPVDTQNVFDQKMADKNQIIFLELYSSINFFECLLGGISWFEYSRETGKEIEIFSFETLDYFLVKPYGPSSRYESQVFITKEKNAEIFEYFLNVQYRRSINVMNFDFKILEKKFPSDSIFFKFDYSLFSRNSDFIYMKEKLKIPLTNIVSMKIISKK